MKRTTLILILLLIAGAGIFIGYRSYKARSEQTNADNLTALEKEAADRRMAELAAAQAEASRLAAEQDRKNTEAAAAEAETRRLAAEAAEKERLAAAARRTSTSDVNTADKDAEEMAANARQAALLRAQDAAAAEKARNDALARLAAAEKAQQETADREAARLKALDEQKAREAALAYQPPVLISRSPMAPDYKRREHYYMQVELKNAAAIKEAEKQPGAAPLK